MPNENELGIVTRVRESFAGKALTERQAKLYSQRLRLAMGREGLPSFSSKDASQQLEEAILLLESGLIERDLGISEDWKNGIKRAAEILEWLSLSNLRPFGVPVYFLSAAAYQVAGYPAMALGQLRHVPDEAISKILLNLLKGNFRETFAEVNSYWRRSTDLAMRETENSINLTSHVLHHIVMCIGTICNYFKSGNELLVERALVKLDSLTKTFLYSRDSYSYLLAKLTTATCEIYFHNSLWRGVTALQVDAPTKTTQALAQFAKAAFRNRRSLIWPGQAEGVANLTGNKSFVLCTPTGSGKTMVATLATVQGLFSDPILSTPRLEEFNSGNLVLYLVPTRALASEVEKRLAQDLSGVSAEPVVVTGLYGGVDWGPTDAWIQREKPTILICTFEKADALIRFLGVLFLNRVRLVVIDEAHMVEYSGHSSNGLMDASSRAYRLEQLGTRLLQAQEQYKFRIIALSAVASRAALAMARWIGSDSEALPITSDYRSTRQMVGHIECHASGHFTFRYDLMDGRSLKFTENRIEEKPYVRAPIPPLPGGFQEDDGPEVSIRAPTFWTAIHLAAEQENGIRPSVLISITQSIEVFSATCAKLLETWETERLPNFHVMGEEPELWSRCLASAADYFSTESIEYRLLSRGIAVHHGKMPGLLARRLKTLIDKSYVRVIIATSTLSEGVNIPVNYLLIPSVCRGPEPISLQEFTNLIGRAGRPGVSTEGHAFVVLPERLATRVGRAFPRGAFSRQWTGYSQLTSNLVRATAALEEGRPEDDGTSALASLLTLLESAWQGLTGSNSADEFSRWLESTAVEEGIAQTPLAIKYLDSLDNFLLSAIQEIESLRGASLSGVALEGELLRIWRSTYAFAAGRNEEHLKNIWLNRGRAIPVQYPDPEQRRKIYRTSLTPLSAKLLVSQIELIKERLLEGSGYASWQNEMRFEFIRKVIQILSTIPSFHISTKLGKSRSFTDWPMLLRWWLLKDTLRAKPPPNKITSWYDFVSQNFVYRSAWGMGSVLGVLLDSNDEQTPIRAMEIDDWPRSGLPWIAFWIKELLTWGTLDPVAAYLLARENMVDRAQAESESQQYYQINAGLPNANDLLDPIRIRRWIENRRAVQPTVRIPRENEYDIDLSREVHEYLFEEYDVSPVLSDGIVIWVDSAGYLLAKCVMPEIWHTHPPDLQEFQFELKIILRKVKQSEYLPFMEMRTT